MENTFLTHEYGLPIFTLFASKKYLESSLYNIVAKLQSFVDFDIILPVQNKWKAPEPYEHEIGGKLSNIILISDRIIEESFLVPIKTKCMEFESFTSLNSNRRFNLNPGIISSSGVSLVSHKKSPIRRSLRDKYWMEDQLIFEDGKLKKKGNTFSEFFDNERIRTLEATTRYLDDPNEYKSLEHKLNDLDIIRKKDLEKYKKD